MVTHHEHITSYRGYFLWTYGTVEGTLGISVALQIVLSTGVMSKMYIFGYDGYVERAINHEYHVFWASSMGSIIGQSWKYSFPNVMKVYHVGESTGFFQVLSMIRHYQCEKLANV